ncbi:MAG TPA: universal stress protein [Chloroflexota bacterium]|nr:universal stress protein [Chloroflexota bacterium]
MQRLLDANGLPQYERILYVTDGSPAAQAAGRHAVFLAQRSQAQLIVLDIIPNSITRRISCLMRGALGEERRIAREAVEEIANLAAASGVGTVTAIESGHRGDAIDRAASRFDVDLVVMSSPGGEDLQRIFGPPHAGSAPLWETRPICVIMC